MNKTFVFTVLIAAGIAAASSDALGQRSGAGSSPAVTPKILERQLSNGLRVRIVEQHELPVVQMSLLVLTGTDADPRGRYGVASLTSAMLTEGAGSRSAVEIADALDALLANLSASSSRDRIVASTVRAGWATCRCAAADGRCRAAPDVPDAGARTPASGSASPRCATRAAIRTRLRPWRSHAASTVRHTATPRRSSAPPTSLEALTPEDLRAFHASAYRPGNSTLIVAGDVDADAVLPLLETHFGKWQPASVRRVARTGAGPCSGRRAS